MFLTSVDAVSVSLMVGRLVPIHVRFRLLADPLRMVSDRAGSEKDQTASMSMWRAIVPASASCGPVRMLTTPAGTSEVSRIW